MNAISYCRVSTDAQAKSGAGLDAQKAAIESYAAANGLNITAAFVDAGVSGAAPIAQRVGLVAAVAAITKGTVLLIAKRDRLGRDQLTTLGIERAIQKRAVRLCRPMALPTAPPQLINSCGLSSTPPQRLNCH